MKCPCVALEWMGAGPAAGPAGYGGGADGVGNTTHTPLAQCSVESLFFLSRTDWSRNWTWWRYYAEYFPHSMVNTAELDPKRNYLFCIYPHGVLSTGVFSALCTNALNVDKVFPHHKTHLLSLHQHFFAPFSREVGLSLGE